MSKIYGLHKALIFSSAAHRKACRSEFQRLNLSDGQPKVLSVLVENEGYLQKDLAKRCHVEPATMTSILANMSKNGLVRKEIEHVSGGKRAFAIYLTDKGREIAEQVNEIVQSAEEKAYEGFSDEERRLIVACLTRLGENLVAASELSE